MGGDALRERALAGRGRSVHGDHRKPIGRVSSKVAPSPRRSEAKVGNGAAIGRMSSRIAPSRAPSPRTQNAMATRGVPAGRDAPRRRPAGLPRRGRRGRRRHARGRRPRLRGRRGAPPGGRAHARAGARGRGMRVSPVAKAAATARSASPSPRDVARSGGTVTPARRLARHPQVGHRHAALGALGVDRDVRAHLAQDRQQAGVEPVRPRHLRPPRPSRARPARRRRAPGAETNGGCRPARPTRRRAAPARSWSAMTACGRAPVRLRIEPRPELAQQGGGPRGTQRRGRRGPPRARITRRRPGELRPASLEPGAANGRERTPARARGRIASPRTRGSRGIVLDRARLFIASWRPGVGGRLLGE